MWITGIRSVSTKRIKEVITTPEKASCVMAAGSVVPERHEREVAPQPS